MDDDTPLKDLIPNVHCTDVDTIFGNQTHIDLVDCRQSLGIHAASSSRVVQQLHQTPSRTLVDLYCTGGVRRAAQQRRSLNLEGLRARDLRTNKPDGSPWDLRRREDRDLAVQLVKTLEPLVAISSPPCTAFSTWNTHLIYARMPAQRVDELLRR